MSNRVVIFSPFAGILEHRQLENQIAKILSHHSASILRVSCSADLKSWCSVMSYVSLPTRTGSNTKARLCGVCRGISEDKLQMHGAEDIAIGDLLQQSDRAWVERHIGEISPDNWMHFEIDSIPFGRMWAYDTILRFKTKEFHTSPAMFEHYLSESRSSALAYRAGKRLLEREMKVEAVLTYSFEYAINRSFLAAFRDTGVSTYSFFAAGPRPNPSSHFAVTSTDVIVDVAFEPRFHEALQVPSLPSEVDEITEHTLESISGRNVFTYSLARQGLTSSQVRGRLGLRPNRPCIIFTVSSPDEIDASQVANLRPAELWDSHDLSLIHTAVSLARRRPHFDVVLRLHPRLFPNSRDRGTSPYVELVGKALDHKPTNLVVDMPKLQLSLYDLALVTDVVVNHRSSSGLELGILGIPVVYIDKRRTPTDARLEASSNPVVFDDVLAQVESALCGGWSETQALMTMRYLVAHLIRTRVPSGPFQTEVPRNTAVSASKSFPNGRNPVALWRSALRPLGRIPVLIPLFLRLRAARLTRMQALRDSPEFDACQVWDQQGSGVACEDFGAAEVLLRWRNWRQLPLTSDPIEELWSLREFHKAVLQSLEPFDGQESVLHSRIQDLGLVPQRAREHDQHQTAP